MVPPPLLSHSTPLPLYAQNPKNEKGGRVWCDGGAYPRKQFVSMEAGHATWRCACFEHLGWSDLRQVYAGCEAEATSCATAPPTKKPAAGATAAAAA